MAFYGILVAINVACFLPLYLLNFRESPNPFEFLLASDKTAAQPRFKWLYAKIELTDPFRVNLDFSVAVLLAAAMGANGTWIVAALAALLTFGFVEIAYSALMQSVFKRQPALAGDISLLKAGLSLAQRRAYWMGGVTLLLLGAIAAAAHWATASALHAPPPPPAVALAMAAALLVPGLYHWRDFGYSYFLARTVYSPLLHLWRNIEYTRLLDSVVTQDATEYERHNHFKAVTLAACPRIVIVCVESYGSVVYRDPAFSDPIAGITRRYEAQLAERGYRFASTYSDAPIFAGGSWLSYASFTYGIEFTQLQLFDGLFAAGSPFGVYESLFHVLKRNGYRNVLLCPLGGVSVKSVDWGQIDRCFQADLKITFDNIDYRGPLVNYFGLVRLYSPLDQYSLNYAYELASRGSTQPFSLFFCTLNSHFPWEAVGEVVADWRTLDQPSARVHACRGPAPDRYRETIQYQLENVLRFVLDRADDDLVVLVFGDHQPPFITQQRMGKQTPVHVIARNPELVDVFLEHGFAAHFDLAGREPRPMRHQGFLSLFLKAMQRAYGATDTAVEYREDGTDLFLALRDEVGHDSRAPA